MPGWRMEHIVRFYPAYDKRSPDPKKNYGIHGVGLLMLVRGPEGAVQFKLFTNWMLPHVQEELDHKTDSDPQYGHLLCHPLPADLGYHSYKPHYEDQGPITDSCEWLDGKPCYYDGSGLNAERIFKVLLEEGDEGVWRELEAYYHQTFDELAT